MLDNSLYLGASGIALARDGARDALGLLPHRASLFTSHLPVLNAPTSTGSYLATFGSNFQLERSFEAVQLILANYGTVAVTLTGVCAAPSSAVADTVTPVGPTGTASPWTAVTFSGSTTPTIPAGVFGRPALLLSDVMPIESVTRTDGSSFFALFTRCGCPASGWTVPGLSAAALPLFNAAAGGRTLSGSACAGDAASANQTNLTAANTVTNGPNGYVVGVRFLSPQRVITLASFGDSLTQGLLTGSGFNGYGRIAAQALSNTTKNSTVGVSFVDGGWSGEPVTSICNRANDLFAAGIVPDIVTVPIDSPNDYILSPTGSGRLVQAAQIYALADKFMNAGATVVLLTSLPYMSSGADIFGAQRAVSSAVVRALARRGAVVFDPTTLVCGYTPTPTMPAVTPAGYLASDGAHINEAAHKMLGAALAGLLSPAVN